MRSFFWTFHWITAFVWTLTGSFWREQEEPLGVPDWDPEALAAHLFNLALHAIDERVMPEFDEVLKMGHCDDSYSTSEDIHDPKVCTDDSSATRLPTAANATQGSPTANTSMKPSRRKTSRETCSGPSQKQTGIPPSTPATGACQKKK